MLYAPGFLGFYKYWPNDGLVRPKLSANILGNKIYSCDRRSIYFVSF